MTMASPILAAVDPGFFIWIIVGIFWFIGQIAEGKKKKEKKRKRREAKKGQASEERYSPAPGNPLDPVSPQDELREFLEQLGAPVQEQLEEPVPEVIETERPMILFDDQPEYTPVEFDEPVAVPTAEPVIVDSYAVKEIKEIEEVSEGNVYATLAEIGSEGELSSCTLSSIRNSSLLVSVRNMQMPMLKMPNIHQTHNTKKHLHAPNLKTKADLKDSIIGQLLLGPPKAMERPEQEVFH